MEFELSSASVRATVVERFYAAVSAGDAAAIGAIIDEHFVDDASIEWPPSLPYGGRVEGARRLRKMFVAMAGSDVKVGPDSLAVISITTSGDTVAAELSFDWYPPGKADSVSSGALELWTFNADKVRAIRAFYWDTAALVAATA
jgi:ketosteroid isomerase-like protein